MLHSKNTQASLLNVIPPKRVCQEFDWTYYSGWLQHTLLLFLRSLQNNKMYVVKRKIHYWNALNELISKPFEFVKVHAVSWTKYFRLTKETELFVRPMTNWLKESLPYLDFLTADSDVRKAFIRPFKFFICHVAYTKFAQQ